MNQQNLSSFIWSVTDLLRGGRIATTSSRLLRKRPRHPARRKCYRKDQGKMENTNEVRPSICLRLAVYDTKRGKERCVISIMIFLLKRVQDRPWYLVMVL